MYLIEIDKRYALYFHTLYPAHRQRKPGNLVLSHSVPIKTLKYPSFQIQEALRVEWRNSMPALPRYQSEGMKILTISLVEIEATACTRF